MSTLTVQPTGHRGEALLAETGFEISVTGAEGSVTLTGGGTLDLRDEPATKVRHRRDFDAQVVARRSGKVDVLWL